MHLTRFLRLSLSHNRNERFKGADNKVVTVESTRNNVSAQRLESERHGAGNK